MPGNNADASPLEKDADIADTGQHDDPPDGGPMDALPIMDATLNDAATSTSPDAGLPADDGGILPDAGPTPDGGTPECTTDGDCGFNGHCDPQSLTCVDCYDDTHCAGQRVCDLTHGHVCRFPCTNGQCGLVGVCDPVEDVCVQCLADTDCGPGQICDASSATCVQCAGDADCTLNPEHHLCNVAAGGVCTGCISDGDCASAEVCNPLGGGTCLPPLGRELCDPCATDEQCGGPADLCIGMIGAGGLIDRSCAIDCSAASNVCPSGFACVAVRNGEMQCRPSYAMPNPTCAATRHLGEACRLDPGDLDPGCGIDGLQDARCETASAGGAAQCVVWCTSDADCASGTCQPGTNGNDVCR